MEEIDIRKINDVDIEDSVLIEGLPGVGHVGKLVVEHLTEEFDSTLLREFRSHHFPPQTTVDDEGLIELARAELYHCKADDTDLLLLTGDHQSQTIEGHYKLSEAFLDSAVDLGLNKLFTIGGIATGEMVEDYRVIGAVNNPSLKDDIEDLGVEFGDEPKSGIIGVSGLLLEFGKDKDIDGACLMGETSGYVVDPKSAKAVSEVLMEALDFEVSVKKLEERAEEMEEFLKKLDESQDTEVPMGGKEDLSYIG